LHVADSRITIVISFCIMFYPFFQHFSSPGMVHRSFTGVRQHRHPGNEHCSAISLYSCWSSVLTMYMHFTEIPVLRITYEYIPDRTAFKLHYSSCSIVDLYVGWFRFLQIPYSSSISPINHKRMSSWCGAWFTRTPHLPFSSTSPGVGIIVSLSRQPKIVTLQEPVSDLTLHNCIPDPSHRLVPPPLTYNS